MLNVSGEWTPEGEYCSHLKGQNHTTTNKIFLFCNSPTVWREDVEIIQIKLCQSVNFSSWLPTKEKLMMKFKLHVPPIFLFPHSFYLIDMTL